MECWNDGMLEWWNGRMMEWQNGRMVEWRNILKNGLAKYSKTRNGLLDVTKSHKNGSALKKENNS